jgi:hypothetical protein
MTALGDSRHEGGADVLESMADLFVALGVRLRERPGTRWMVEMHPTTRSEFDIGRFNARYGSHDVRIYASRYVAPGEYRLSQRGFGTGGDGGSGESDRWPASS